jgi:hypothetical protein
MTGYDISAAIRTDVGLQRYLSAVQDLVRGDWEVKCQIAEYLASCGMSVDNEWHNTAEEFPFPPDPAGLWDFLRNRGCRWRTDEHGSSRDFVTALESYMLGRFACRQNRQLVRNYFLHHTH